jgi:uncharacterized membrane protein
MSDLIAITYDDQNSGRQAFERLDYLQKMKLLALEDAAFAYKDEKGKVKVTQTLEKAHTGSTASWGFFWGFLIGLIFGGPLFWGLTNALIGALIGKSADLGIDNKFIKEVGESLEPGGSALFMLVVKATPDKVLPELEKFGGHVYQTSLSTEDEQKLRQVIEHEDVKAAVSDNLEVE